MLPLRYQGHPFQVPATAIAEFFKHNRLMLPLFALAAPISLHFLLSASAGLIDNMLVARVGEEALAIAGAATRYFWLALIIINGVCVGVSVLLNRAYGEGKVAKFKAYSAVGGAYVLITTVALCTAISLFASSLAGFLLVNELASRVETVHYFRLMSVLLSVSALSLFLDNYLYVLGHQIMAVKSYMVEVVVNGVVSYWLAFGVFGLPELGLMGPICSSIGVRSVRTLFVFGVLKRSSWVGGRKPTRRLAVQCFQTTFPVVMTNATWIIGLFIVQWAIAALGTIALVGLSLYLVLEMFLLSAMSGVNEALAIRVGRLSSKKRPHLIRAYTQAAVTICSLLSVGVLVLCLVLASQLPSVFPGLSADTYDSLKMLMYVLAFGVILRSYVALFNAGVLRAIGDVTFCFRVEAITLWLVMLPILLGAISLGTLPLYFIFLVALTDDVVKLMVFIVRYQRSMRPEYIDSFLEVDQSGKQVY